MPPSKEELEKRLIARNQDGKQSIKNRLLSYSNDIEHSDEYDHVIVNDNVETCFNSIKKIISIPKLIKNEVIDAFYYRVLTNLGFKLKYRSTIEKKKYFLDEKIINLI